MKIKLLTTIIAGVLLAGCGGGNDNSVDGGGGQTPDTHTLQAFDPAIINMIAKYDCGDEKTGTLTSRTAYSGKVTTKDENVIADPSACSFTFTGDENTQDVTNGKSMNGVTYTIPKGLAQKEQLVTASPLTTYLTKKLNGAAFTEAAANEALAELGLDGLVNKGRISNVTELFSNTEAVINALPSDSKDRGTILATTMVLSDTLKSLQGESFEEIATVTKTITASVTAEYPFYPAVGKDAPTDELIYLDVKDTATKVKENPEADVTLPKSKPAVKVPEDTKPVPPPTGGTGGTGGSGDGGSGGGNGN